MGAPGYNDESNNFNDILERCIRDVESGLITFEECVAQHPQYPELADLLDLALGVNALPRPRMPAAFTARTQKRLQAHLRQRVRGVRSAQSWGRWFPLQRAIAVLLIIAVIIFAGGAGLVRAASNAVPGESLYDVKRAVERTELFFANAQTRPSVLYHVAEARLSEIDTLSLRGQAVTEQFMNEAVESVAVALLSQTDSGAQTRLAAEAVSSVKQAAALGAINPSLAQQSLAKLQVTGNVFTGNDQQATATSESIAQSATALPTFTPTSTFTPTATTPPSATWTATFTPTSTNTPVAATTAPTIPATTIIPTATITPSATATLHPTASPTTALGPGPARVLTGIPTTQPQATQAATVPATQVATDQPTVEASGTEAATSEATASVEPTQTETPTPTLTETVATEPPTLTPTYTPTPKPTNTPTFTPTFTPTNTATPLPTATPTATPNGLPDVSFKQQWQQVNFQNCPPEGQGGDPVLNQTRNRIDEGNYQQVAFNALAALPWPADAQGKRHDQWSPPASAEIGRSEGLPLTVEGYVIKVRENDPEAQNCNAKDFKTWQLWLVDNPGNDQNRALIVQITPRVREKHTGWTLDKLNSLASAKVKIRVSGWLMFNEERADEVGKSRASLWEIHPVMQLGVSKNNQWVNLDDLQP